MNLIYGLIDPETRSSEAIDKTVAKNLGRECPQEKRDQISASLKGHSVSQETHDKIAATLRARYARERGEV